MGINVEDLHWIVLNRSSFSQREVSIPQGDTMRFFNPVTGVTQHLCLAAHFECIRNNDGPRKLQAPGVMVAPGHTLLVTFPASGDYQVIGSQIPALLLTIHVTSPPSLDDSPDTGSHDPCDDFDGC